MTEPREFCEHCGAHLPPRNGEGTCPQCAPPEQPPEYAKAAATEALTDLDADLAQFFSHREDMDGLARTLKWEMLQEGFARIIAEHTAFEIAILIERADLAYRYRREDTADHIREVAGWERRYDVVAKQRDGLLEAAGNVIGLREIGVCREARDVAFEQLAAAIAAAEKEPADA